MTGKPKHLPQSAVFVFAVYSHYIHPKYLRRDFNHAHCVSHNCFMDIASVMIFFLSTALVCRSQVFPHYLAKCEKMEVQHYLQLKCFLSLASPGDLTTLT